MDKFLSNTEDFIKHYESRIEETNEKIADKNIEISKAIAKGQSFFIIGIKQTEKDDFEHTLRFLESKLTYYKSLL